MLSAVLLISAYAFLFSLPDAVGVQSHALPSKARVEVVVDTSAAAKTAAAKEEKRRSDDEKSGSDEERHTTLDQNNKGAAGEPKLDAKTLTERLAEMKKNRPPRTVNHNKPKRKPRPYKPPTPAPPKWNVGYVISLTGCPKGTDDPLIDGAAVLKHSIHLNSHANPESGSRYGYKMYAIVHPDAIDCAGPLFDIGYDLLIRDVPVPVDEIKGDFLRTKVVDNGCCGEKEYIKLHAYTILKHPVVVHLDLDTIVMKPMDDLFDVILSDLNEEPNAPKEIEKRLSIMFDKPLPPKVDAFFTQITTWSRPGRSMWAFRVASSSFVLEWSHSTNMKRLYGRATLWKARDGAASASDPSMVA